MRDLFAEEVLHLADSLRNLRAHRLIGLHKRCTQVKVINLVLDLGERSGPTGAGTYRTSWID
jgi:hypothetical protein